MTLLTDLPNVFPKKRFLNSTTPVLAIIGLLLSIYSQAEEYLSFYVGEGLDHNFLEFPEKLVKAELEFDSSWLAAAAYKRSCSAGDWLESRGVTGFCEAVIAKHWGLQHQFEVAVAYQLVSPPWEVSSVDLHISAAIGPSYALGNPSYEDGPEDNPEKRYRFQNFNAYEIILKPHQKNWYAFLRIHHRSGMYGLVAPGNVGSNFLSAGVSFRLGE